MTNQEAIEILKIERDHMIPTLLAFRIEAMNMAISALQAQDVPDMTVGDMTGRRFVELLAEYRDPELCAYKEYKGKPYFSIKYTENGEEYIGYSTYSPKVLSQYLREYFMAPVQPEQTRTQMSLANCISKRAAIDVVEHITSSMSVCVNTDECHGMKRMQRQAVIELANLPSAQPEPHWIPVSERLPEEYGEYICTMENGQVQECGFVPENQRGLVDGWSTCEADGHKFLGYIDVLAWMPLPEPYAERRTDEGSD